MLQAFNSICSKTGSVYKILPNITIIKVGLCFIVGKIDL